MTTSKTMCIILTQVESVTNTQIYISSSKDRTRQLVIYTNTVDSPLENAMILPVPNPLSVELLNFKHYKDIFEDCNKCFKHIDDHRYDSGMRSLYASASLPHRPPLPVYTVGSYQASIVPSFDDFDRLNMKILRVNPQVFTLLKDTYDSSFGFIVCQLRTGSHQYHPFAYTHNIHSSRLLFTPTLHYHLGESSVTADWDHTIYSPMTDLYTTGQYYFKDTKNVDWNKLPEAYRWPSQGNFTMNRHCIHGNQKNKDLWLKNLVSSEHFEMKSKRSNFEIKENSPIISSSSPKDSFLRDSEFTRNLQKAFRKI